MALFARIQKVGLVRRGVAGLPTAGFTSLAPVDMLGRTSGQRPVLRVWERIWN